MLKLMRDSFQQLKWILIAIVAIFILFIFVDWGAGGTSGKSAQTAYAARVNGEMISNRDFSRALYYAEENYKRMYGNQLTPEVIEAMGLPKQVLDSLIDQRLLLQEAKRLDLSAQPEEVRKRILEIPTLNPDGKFVGAELYTRYVTGQLGYQSPAEFEEELAREITLAKIESAIQNSIVVSPKAAETEYRRMSENAKIRYVMIPAAAQMATVTVTPAEVEAYYKANQSKYAHGEQRNLKYLLADYARLRAQIVPNDAELRQKYEASKEDFKTPQSAHVLHILVKVPQGAPADVDAAAKAKAEGIVKQLRAGGDFAALAKANSDDPSSSTKGGDMGWVDMGQTVESFERAIFSVPLNQISDPIRSTEFGYHIVKVVERRDGGYRSFDEVKGQLASQTADVTARDQARSEITRLFSIIKEQKPKTPEQFAAFANDKVSSNDTGWFAKADLIPGLGANPPLATWAFSAKQGEVGEITGTQRGVIVPYLVGTRAAGITPLADIRERVENDAKMAKARDAAKAALAAALPGATAVDAVAAKLGMNTAEITVNRQGVVTGFQGDTTDLVNTAMSANVGELKGPIVVQDGAVAFQVVEQKRVDQKEVEQNRASYVDALRQQQWRSLRKVLVDRLRKGAKVEVNDDVVKSASPNAGA